MIYYIHKNRFKVKPIQIIAATLLFFNIVFFFFYSFTDICFDTIDKIIPSPVLITLFAYMYMDIIYGLLKIRRFYRRAIINFIITSIQLISWVSINKYIVYLGAIIYLRLPETYYYYKTIHEMLRPYYLFYRIFIILRLILMMLVIGHVIACTFYLIDISLIQREYFGTILQNPSLYYQGQITAFSPIVGLQQSGRYTYAMYYSISLVSTVAYGDIIPKNFIQDAYVIVLLILSTIMISYILEQMIMVFRRDKNIRFRIIQKIKFFRSMLTDCQFQPQNRNILTRYLMNKMIKDQYYPNFLKLTTQTRKCLIMQSICRKCESVFNQLSILYGYSAFSNSHKCLPTLLLNHLLLSLKYISLPSGIIFINNSNIYQKISFFILINGKIKTGYTANYLAPNKIVRTIQMKKNQYPILLGWRQLILNSKANNTPFRARTEKTTQFYTIQQNTFRDLISEYRANYNQNFEKIEYYALQKQKSITLDYMHCALCSKTGHQSFQCPLCHYKPKLQNILKRRQNIRQQSYLRKKRVNKKQINTQNLYRNKDVSQEQLDTSLAMNTNKNINKKYKDLLIINKTKVQQVFETVEFFQIFHSQFNLL